MTNSMNLRHWSDLEKTDPKHTKPFSRAGGFKGTAIKPIWTEYRLTEHLGPCGVGWGMEAPEFQTVPAGDEILVFCILRCWYLDNGKRADLYGVGGDKAVVKRNDGKVVTDDEAYKKAFTDALGNAFKHLGAGADVHMGLFDDSKYVAEVRREFNGEHEAAKPNGNGKVNGAALPPHPEEPPAVGDARRIQAMIDRLHQRIKSAPDEHRLEVIMHDARDGNLKEIEAGGPEGVACANALRAQYNAKLAALRGAAA